MAKGSSKITESNSKPLGGSGGSGNGKEPITVQPFRVQPENLQEALGEKGRNIGMMNALEGANPFYAGGAEGDFSENCQRCVVAYEARRRGYDVIAQPTYPGDNLPTNGEWLKSFKDAKEVNVGSKDYLKAQANLEAKMKEYGNGSRGIVRIPGHVFNVENVNGKVRYVDAQTNTVYSSKGVFSRLGSKAQKVSLVRTDNLDFSDNARRAVTPVTDTMKRIKRTKNTYHK